ncbi:MULTISPECIES: acyloxyacyl hydrolase [unclassified Variovorax]|uniref:acyloxyacyl hydrolase n=1 Tax=unclassified Variovorax TaxID=663243 RepID=UPI0025759A8E|nr:MULTISPECIES: acyloxyacyl hydrolase [unclassified Variovorax]MDM0090837.1 acyloxyacyl hydrolase [Variovorax sp. J22G40]MDM0149161.1 acyloxyacyl hydrolase [Variovorax sp. J2P1-31]
MKNKFIGPRAALALGALLFCATPALAHGDATPGFYVEGGHALHGGADTEAWALGAVLPWSPSGAGVVNGRSFAWDVFASQWRAPDVGGDGRRGYAQLGVIATWRYRFDQGASPWFVEGGLGGTVMNHVYRTPERSFSTAFQFTEVAGLGRSFGARGEHELSVRLQHVSNGGIKKPNPGANFVRLRYLYRF